MNRRLPKISYANIVSTLALFLALGGASYAAVKLPAGSVGHAQVRSSAITSAQVRDHTLRARDFAAGALPGAGTGAPGPQGPQGEPGPAGPAGPAGKDASATLAPASVTRSKLDIVTVGDYTGENTTTPKFLSVNCPSGYTILSGSAGALHNGVPSNGAALTYDAGLPFQNGWAANAYSVSAGSVWSLNVTATCIRN